MVQDLRTYRFRLVRETIVEVTLDAEKFTPQFMAQFNETIFIIDDVDEHAEHLAALFEDYDVPFIGSRAFVEGYGPPSEMGIECKIVDENVEIERIDATPNGS